MIKETDLEEIEDRIVWEKVMAWNKISNKIYVKWNQHKKNYYLKSNKNFINIF